MRIGIFLATLCVASPAAADTELKRAYSTKELASIQALGPDHFRRTATIQDDQLEPVATIATHKGFISRGKFTDRVRSDNFFRAFVDKATGNVRIQLYAEVSYNLEWRNFSSASVLIAGRPASIPLTVVERKVVTCAMGLCSYRETVAIPLSDAMLNEIAAGTVSGPSRLWPFRLKAQNDLDFEDAAIPAEAAGLLTAVSDYRRRLNITPVPPAPAR